jgi:hypothetical protein
MIEKELADRMRSVLADEPPLGFDPDEVVDRAGRRRRTTFATVGATGVVLAIAVTAAVMTRGGAPGSDVGVQVSTTPTRPDAACPSVPPGERPPPHFPGSDQIVARLDEAAPRLIATHLPGVSVQPSETGMIAYDCPPNVGTVYQVNGADQRVMVYLVHARGGLDLDNDQYAGDPAYQLLADEQASDGTRFRVYGSSSDGTKTGGQAGTGLVVVRFGLDGMVTEASVSGTGPLVAGRLELQALASDPELRF